MIASDFNLLCKQAEPYYYDFSCNQRSKFIPESIIKHIEQCRNCREEIGRLKSILSQAEAVEPEQSHGSSAITRLLRLHFAYIGEHVTCNTVRPFLPALLDPALQIRIPSPITAHLDNCQQCSEDLETIRGLRLNRKQLFQLSQLFAEEPPPDSAQRSQMSLAKMQELHNIVHELSERPESGVVTVFHIDKAAEAQAVGESDDPYTGFPIKVEIRSRQDEADPKQSASTTDFGTALKHKASVVNLRLLVKAAGVAAIILVAVALLLNTPAAKAITIDQIYEALEKATNIHISSFVPGKTEPTQERWISRALNIYLTRTAKQSVLWDISNDVRKTRQLDTGLTETITLTSDLHVSAERKMRGSLGLMPFDDLSRIPKDAKWNRVPDVGPEASTEQTEVYDLTLAKPVRGGPVGTRKCRLFVDPKTNRPIRTEFYRKLPADSDYILTSRMVVEYVSDSKIQTVIKEASF